MNRFRLDPEEDGFFEEDRQRIDVELERQHDPLGHESVALVSFTWIQRQPHSHPVGSAAQPQRLRQMRFAGTHRSRIGNPQYLHTRSQHGGRRVERAALIQHLALDEQHAPADVEQNILGLILLHRLLSLNSMGFGAEAGQRSRHQTGRMESQRADVDLLRPVQRRRTAAVRCQFEEADVAVGGVDQENIPEDVEQQHLPADVGHRAQGIVQAGHIARVDAHLVRIGRDAVASDDQLLLPPEQPAGHHEILLLRFVAEEFPAAGDERVEGETRAPGHG